MIQISEYVGRGHPDRLADTLADELAYYIPSCWFPKDVECKSVSLDVLLTDKNVTIAGEINGWINLKSGKRDRIKREIREHVNSFLAGFGYFSPDFKINIDIKEQSPEIGDYSNQHEYRSGDQSISYGFAVKSQLGTDSYMPEDWELAKNIVDGLERFNWLNRDSKCLVAVERQKGGKIKVKDITVSVNHQLGSSLEELRQVVVDEVIKPLFLKYGLDLEGVNISINPGGSFTVGGLNADTGATNRKLMASTYGSSVAHGGGGCYGKDISKVDRLGAYWARFICKNVVAAGLCDWIELGVWFQPGSRRPRYFVKNHARKVFDGVHVTADHLLAAILMTVEDHNHYEKLVGWFGRTNFNFAFACREGHFGLSDATATALRAEWERLYWKDELFNNMCEVIKKEKEVKMKAG